MTIKHNGFATKQNGNNEQLGVIINILKPIRRQQTTLYFYFFLTNNNQNTNLKNQQTGKGFAVLVVLTRRTNDNIVA